MKDLWEIRLSLLIDKIDAPSEEDMVFSSQPQSETETGGKHDGVGRKWKTTGKDMPTLIQTLALCYLGMILLRLPVSIGEIHRYVTLLSDLSAGVLLKQALVSWAVREDIPFIRAVRHIPQVMKKRLPAQYLKALDTTACSSKRFTSSTDLLPAVSTRAGSSMQGNP